MGTDKHIICMNTMQVTGLLRYISMATFCVWFEKGVSH
jgi:hypothetical protein